MKNIERFEIYTAYILGKAYNEFPFFKTIDAKSVVAAVALEPGNPSDPSWENTFVVETYRWLAATGFLIERDGAPARAIPPACPSLSPAARSAI